MSSANLLMDSDFDLLSKTQVSVCVAGANPNCSCAACIVDQILMILFDDVASESIEG